MVVRGVACERESGSQLHCLLTADMTACEGVHTHHFEKRLAGIPLLSSRADHSAVASLGKQVSYPPTVACMLASPFKVMLAGSLFLGINLPNRRQFPRPTMPKAMDNARVKDMQSRPRIRAEVQR
jgi:hypothetical protein